MRIVTLNTWKNEGDYPRRLRLMTDGLSALAPDVACLQECFAAEACDTAATLAKAAGFKAATRPARAKPRLHEGRLIESTSGLAILARRGVADDALVLSSVPEDGERIALRLDVRAGQWRLRILNLHLTHLPGEAAGLLRARQLSEALDWALDGWSEAMVVAGDFNAPFEAPELSRLAELACESDRPEAARPLRPTLQGAGPHDRVAAPRTIDHAVLIDPVGEWRVRRRFLALDRPDPDGWFPSDHAAVVMDLEPAYSR